jgi:hypothetical protein
MAAGVEVPSIVSAGLMRSRGSAGALAAMVGAPDNAKAAFAELADQRVGANHIARLRLQIVQVHIHICQGQPEQRMGTGLRVCQL